MGVLNDMPLTNGYVLDIGGGSAQTSEIRTGQFHRGQSFTLGALALTERFVKNDPIKTTEFKAIQKEINHQLDTAFWTKKSTPPHWSVWVAPFAISPASPVFDKIIHSTRYTVFASDKRI